MESTSFEKHKMEMVICCKCKLDYMKDLDSITDWYKHKIHEDIYICQYCIKNKDNWKITYL